MLIARMLGFEDSAQPTPWSVFIEVMATVVPCPTCERPVEWVPSSPWRPFCSERCKLIDLGAWASEQRAIPGAVETDDTPKTDSQADSERSENHAFRKRS